MYVQPVWVFPGSRLFFVDSQESRKLVRAVSGFILWTHWFGPFRVAGEACIVLFTGLGFVGLDRSSRQHLHRDRWAEMYLVMHRTYCLGNGKYGVNVVILSQTPSRPGGVRASSYTRRPAWRKYCEATLVRIEQWAGANVTSEASALRNAWNNSDIKKHSTSRCASLLPRKHALLSRPNLPCVFYKL